MASGLNRIQRLAHSGVDIKEKKQPGVGLDEIWVPAEGKFAHPRFGKALDPKLVADIKENGVHTAVKVWEAKVDKAQTGPFVLCYGSRRLAHALAAREELRKEKKPTAHIDYVPAVFFEGTELEFFLERRREDRDPSKVFHLPSEVAFEFAQIRKVGGTDDNLLESAPPGYTRGVVQAMERWPSLPKAVQRAFDEGVEIDVDGKPERREVSIALLPALVKNVARDDQFETLKQWVADGIKSHQGATRRANADAIREQVAEQETDEAVELDDTDIEEMGPFANESAPPSEERPKRQRDIAVQKRSVKKVQRVDAALSAKKNVSATAATFMAGAKFAADLEVEPDSLNPMVVAFLNGIRWRDGSNEVEPPNEVIEALSAIEDKKQGAAKKMAKRKSARKKVG